MNDEDPARELSALHADTTAAIDAATPQPAEPDDLVGPVVLTNGMWATKSNGWWRVTIDRDGTLETFCRYTAATLDRCRQWAAVVGPHPLPNGMWGTWSKGFWWLTRDREGVDPVGRRCAFSLDECHEWAEKLTPQ
ncbi:hypothetical protein [Nocardia salmonicida]|uniref:hypothetical protein n=1 Tax=Nocardia salmonicida TaxID=53431 RepID=UPI0007A3F30D|nr:hypothetical protein [Nocardia salmonicida]